MKPTQKENREELLALAVDLLGDAVLLDCLLERYPGGAPWSGPVWNTLLDRLRSYISENSREIALLAGRLTQPD